MSLEIEIYSIKTIFIILIFFLEKDKIWLNLLLDFTKNFSELNVPNFLLQTNSENFGELDSSSFRSNCESDIDSGQDLLDSIVEIAINSLESDQIERRIFACQLLLNTHDSLDNETIQTKIMPILETILDNESTTLIEFILLFVFANYSRRFSYVSYSLLIRFN